MASIAKFDTWQNSAGVNYGTVLQVVSTQLTTTFSTNSLITSGGATVTGLSVNITPMYATSKILVLGHIVVGTNSGTQAHFKLLRNSTEVGNGASAGNRAGVISRTWSTTTNIGTTAPFSYLDSPASTSLLTYSIKMGVDNASYSAFVNRIESDYDGSYGTRGASSITVMEIAQ